MNHKPEDIEKGKEVIRIEAKAIAALGAKMTHSFADAVEMIYNCKGRVIITGMGKSGIVARKIVATMNSTGTPALFMHPSDAVHGDLGMVRDDDVVICLSKSGDTHELLQLLPMLKRVGVPIISFVGNLNSHLAHQSDIVLDISVEEEACPHDLTPTSSTTAMLVMGDALSVTLLEKKNFSKEDCAAFHPGGNLGKRLLLKIEELMVNGAAVPRVELGTKLKDAIIEMTSKRLGATCVVDGEGKLRGIITDGDLRRLLQKTTDVTRITAEDAMSKNPKTIKKGVLAAKALQTMEEFSITQLIIVDDHHRPLGIVHLHDLVKAGLGSEPSA
jgi:arabinose-5-phosphate isomerase